MSETLTTTAQDKALAAWRAAAAATYRLPQDTYHKLGGTTFEEVNQAALRMAELFADLAGARPPVDAGGPIRDREVLKTMIPAQIHRAYKDGRLDALLSGHQ